MKHLSMITIGDITYSLDQADTDGTVTEPTVAGLSNLKAGPADFWLLASIQQLHTAEPELIVHNWIDDEAKHRIEASRQELLVWAAECWRDHYDPGDFAGPAPDEVTAVPDRVPWFGTDANTLFVASLFNVPLWLSVGIWLVPVGTPRLLPAAVGIIAAIAIQFTAHLIVQRDARKALRNTWPISAALLVTLAAVGVWIWSGCFPGGAYAW